MAALTTLENLAAEFRARRPIRSTSLIVTLFGDVVSQHGGLIWLGSLVDALGLLGIDERLVRTSTFRLVQEGWLESRREGRRSFYRLTEYGRRECARAERRIYAAGQPRWDGNWTLVIPVTVPEEKRERLRHSLMWQGFGQFAPNLHAHPGSDLDSVTDTLDELGLRDQVLVMQATTASRVVAELIWRKWNLEGLSAQYTEFVRRFRPVHRAISRARALGPEQCFTARLLLIHEYRRILLHDPELPADLLPRQWPGLAARQLTTEIYRAVAEGSMRYIAGHLESAGVPMPVRPEASFNQRFTD